MGETVEKIYCCDRDNNDSALTAAILANGNNRRDDWGPMAAMMGGGMNNWMNNHWKDEQALKIQDLKFELSQERQNNLINERFNRLGNCGCGGNSCGCGCGQ